MPSTSPEVLVVGHLCLDIIPGFPPGAVSLSSLLVPGKLVDVVDAVLSTGGAVSNTGLALHRLGFRTGLAGKIGDDYFGDAILKLLRRDGDHLVERMIVSKGEGSSYSVVISPPGIDRIIFHSPGANDTFAAADVPDAAMAGARLLHFGYPPLMRSFYRNGGAELSALFRRAGKAGLAVSLDMARPDPDGLSGKADWLEFFANVLPDVDVFLPSIDELLFMTQRPLFDELVQKAGDQHPAALLNVGVLAATADRMLSMGPAIVGFKLGNQGFYLKVTGDPDRLAKMAGLALPDIEAWRGKELLAPCRRVKVAGTLGAGDCTIAGFLGSLLKGLTPDQAASMAVAVGAASVEVMDANSGVPAWDAVRSRLDAGWPTDACRFAPEDWETTPEGNCRPGGR